MTNANMEAIARDYSELHIDISAVGTAADEADAETMSPQTPTTFMSMTTPKGTPDSARKKGKKGRFNLGRIFGSLKRKSPASFPKPNVQSVAEVAEE